MTFDMVSLNVLHYFAFLGDGRAVSHQTNKQTDELSGKQLQNRTCACLHVGY